MIASVVRHSPPPAPWPSCANSRCSISFSGGLAAGRFEDLRIAAEILRGHQVNEGCRFWIVPGSRAVYLEALRKGLIRLFTEAGAMVAHPGSTDGFDNPGSG